MMMTHIFKCFPTKAIDWLMPGFLQERALKNVVNFIFGKSSNLGNGQNYIEWNNSHDIYIIRKTDKLSKCY